MKKETAKEKLITVATILFRERGYSATSVDALCSQAGVTKGAFFHHFESKEDLAKQAADNWSKATSHLFDDAPYHLHDDPFDRIVAYINFRKDIIKGAIPEFTCLAGTLVQETYFSSDDIRGACRESIFGHAQTLLKDITQAKRLYAPKANWNPGSLARYFQVVLQGSFILTKASSDPSQSLDALDHLSRYVHLLFGKSFKDREK